MKLKRLLTAGLIALWPLVGTAQTNLTPSRIVLFQTALPFVIPPTGTMGNNGAVTLGTALPAAYPNGYMYFGAGQIVASGAGSAAGWYYFTCSSTTVCTVFNNTYTIGQPTVPASPVAFATTGPGAFTGVITEQAAQAFSLPASAVGPNDGLRVSLSVSMTNNADSKTINVKADGIGGTVIYASAITSVAAKTILAWLYSRGVTNVQMVCDSSPNVCSINGAAGSFATTALDMTQAHTIGATMVHATATDAIVCEQITIELLKSPQ